MAIGVTSLSTRVEVTPETLFQWGSITKVWTTTLVMQLVDEGLLDLDAPAGSTATSSPTPETATTAWPATSTPQNAVSVTKPGGQTATAT